MSSRTEYSDTRASQARKRSVAKFNAFLSLMVLGIVAVPSSASAADFASYMDTSDLKDLTNGLAWYGILMQARRFLVASTAACSKRRF